MDDDGGGDGGGGGGASSSPSLPELLASLAWGAGWQALLEKPPPPPNLPTETSKFSSPRQSRTSVRDHQPTEHQQPPTTIIMARAKKPEEKPKEGATLSIDVDSFVRTRDSVRIYSSHSPSSAPSTRPGAYSSTSIPISSRSSHHPSSLLPPPHSNNHSSDQLSDLESRIPTSTRRYPEPLSRRDHLLDLLHVRASIVYFPTRWTSDPANMATLCVELDTIYFTQQSLIWKQVVTGLATLQDAIQTLSSAYIKHTNAVLGEHGAGLDVDSALAKLGENPLLRLGDLNRAVSPAKSVVADAPDKKERKKRQHDPNAPKRPLTPFFLYMQTARPIIAEDLGSDFAKGAVSNEGTRRWGTMAPEDKQVGITSLYT